MRGDRLAALIANDDVLLVLEANLPAGPWSRDDPNVRSAVELAAEFMMEHHASVPLGMPLPGLSNLDDEVFEPLEITSRAYAVLLRNDLANWSDLAALSMDNLRGFRLGEVSLFTLVRGMLWRLLESVESGAGEHPRATTSFTSLGAEPSAGTTALTAYATEPSLCQCLADLVGRVGTGVDVDRVWADEFVKRMIGGAAEAIGQRRPDASLGQLLPGLHMLNGNDSVLSGDLPNREKHILARQGIKTWGQLAQVHLYKLFELRLFGRMALHVIVSAALRRTLMVVMQTEELPITTTPTEKEKPPSRPKGELVPLPLRTLAEWALTNGGPTRLGEVFQLNPELRRLPREVAAAWKQAQEKPLADLLGRHQLPDTIVLADQLLDELDERRRVILTERLNPSGPTSRQSLATRFGISRQRVKQLENSAQQRLRRVVTERRYAPLRWRVADLHYRLGDMFLIDGLELAAAFQHPIAGDPPRFSQSDLVMLWLAGPYRSRGRWLVHHEAVSPDAESTQPKPTLRSASR